MASTVLTSAAATATSSNANGGTVAWTSLTNITVEDGARCTATTVPTTTGKTEWLQVVGFGGAVPAGATIDGIIVEPKCSKSAGTPILADFAMRIVKGGSIGSTDKASATDWNLTTDVFRTYGGAADKWGETWTATDINSATFGFAIAVTKISGGAVNARVDYAKITVHYTPASGFVPRAVMV